ncbi:hypothetical protein JXQ31_20940 [candidate division KSB1 bacterium]|nr:hypothetical protein [candidate division KSB1 bacterium]
MKKLLILIIVFTIAVKSFAQTEKTRSKWGFGTSITYPLANIYLVHINFKLNEKHKIFFGPCFQNFKHESFKVNAYTLLLGYRYFFWKGLHVETEVYPAYNNIFSNVTQRHYPGIEMWGELKIGYQFNFYGNRLFIQPAPGIGFGFFQTNKPPNFDEEIKYPIFTPQLLIGFRL